MRLALVQALRHLGPGVGVTKVASLTRAFTSRSGEPSSGTGSGDGVSSAGAGGATTATGSSGTAAGAEAEAVAFVRSLGHPQNLAEGVARALRDSGLSGLRLLATVRALAGRPEVGEDGGLNALAAAVAQDLARAEGRALVRFHVVPSSVWARLAGPDGSLDWSSAGESALAAGAFTVEALEGMSVADVARHGRGPGAALLAEHLECACSGIMACSTCHVIVASEWFEAVGCPETAEQDMIDLAFLPEATSRLGCQLRLAKGLDGLVLRLPKGANNLMDHIPFPDQ